MRTRWGLALTAAALLALAGCWGSGAGDDAGDGAGADAGMASEVAADGADVQMDVSAPTQRQVIITASATLRVGDPAAAADAVASLAEAAGGRVEGREEYAGGEDDPGWATLTLRIPADDLSTALADLDGVGTVVSVSQSEEDVTGTVVDLDARIESLQTSTDRLLEIMADADDTTDLLAVEKQVSERQAELESLQSQRDALGDQVAMATLTVSLETQPVTIVEARGGFLGGLESGWNALVAFVGGLLVALGALLPWAIALGIPAVIVVMLLRRRRRPDEPVTTPIA